MSSLSTSSSGSAESFAISLLAPGEPAEQARQSPPRRSSRRRRRARCRPPPPYRPCRRAGSGRAPRRRRGPIRAASARRRGCRSEEISTTHSPSTRRRCSIGRLLVLRQLGDGVDGVVDAGHPHLQRAELLEVARDRRLGRARCPRRRAARRAGTGSSRRCRPTGARRGAGGGSSARVPSREPAIPGAGTRSSPRIACMPVRRLLPDPAARSLEHLGRDLLAAMRRQAVQHDRPGARLGDERRRRP